MNEAPQNHSQRYVAGVEQSWFRLRIAGQNAPWHYGTDADRADLGRTLEEPLAVVRAGAELHINDLEAAPARYDAGDTDGADAGQRWASSGD